MKKTNKQGKTAVDIALQYGNAYAADIVIRELSATRLDSLLLEDPELMSNLLFPKNLFITEDQCTFGDENTEDENPNVIVLPSVGKSRSRKSCQDRFRHSQSPIPKFDPRRSSKIMCSYLLQLRSMQETGTYRQGFPLIDMKRNPSINVDSDCTSNGTASPSTLQVEVRPRRGSSRRGSSRRESNGVNAKVESASSSPKNILRKRQSQNVMKLKGT